MPLIRTRVGTDDQGRPVFNYRQDPPDPSKPVMLTGPLKGDVELADGTVYNVSDDWIEVASHEHAGELAHHIGVRHEQDGHPDHQPNDPFVHECTDHCGAAKREA